MKIFHSDNPVIRADATIEFERLLMKEEIVQKGDMMFSSMLGFWISAGEGYPAGRTNLPIKRKATAVTSNGEWRVK